LLGKTEGETISFSSLYWIKNLALDHPGKHNSWGQVMKTVLPATVLEGR